MPDLALDIWLVAHDQFESVFKKLGVEAEGLRGKIGLLAGGFGVLAGGVLAKSVKDAADFESVTQALANNTNMGAAGLAAMRDAAIKLSEATGQDPEKIAEGYMHIANHAYEGAAALNIATAATKNAAATNGDAAEDANVLAGVLREYNVQQKDLARNADLATHYMDTLHNAVANSNWTMKDFTEGSKRAIATAGLFGVPLSQVTAQLAVLSEHGFPTAEVAALNWSGMLRSLEAPNAKAVKGMEALHRATGVDLLADVKELHHNAAFLPQFLADVQKATGGDFNKIRLIMPQSSYATVLAALVKFREEREKIEAVTAAAEAGKQMKGMVGTNEAFAAQQKTLAGQMKDFKAVLKDTSIVIGTALIPMLTKMMTAAMPIIQHIATWISHHQKLTAEILAGVAVVGTLIGALLILGPAIAAIASPIGLIVVAVGAAIGGLVALLSTSSGLRDALVGIWSKIADDAGALWQWLTGIWNGISGDAMLLWENLGSWLSSTWTGIVSDAGAIWNTITSALRAIWNTIAGDAKGAAAALASVPAAFRPIIAAIAAIFAPLVDFFTAVWDTLTGDAVGATQALLNLSPTWQAVVGAIVSVFTGLKDAVGVVWSTLTGDAQGAQVQMAALSGGWRTAVQAIGSAFSALGTAAKAVWETLGHALNTVWTTLIKPVLTAFGTEWKRFAHDIVPLLGPALKNIVASLRQMIAPFVAAFSLLVSTLSGAWKGFWQGGALQMLKDSLQLLAALIKASLHILSDALLIVLAALGGNWKVAWNKMKDLVGTVLAAIYTALSGSQKILGDAAGAVAGAIKGAFMGIVTWVNANLITPALHWGETIMKNIGEGIKKAAQGTLDAMKDFAKKLLKLIPHLSPAEEGPLSAMPNFHYIGDALRAAIPHVRAAATDLMGAAGLAGGSLGVGIGASGHLGGGGGAASTFNAGHTVSIAPNITIQGGTFTDKQGIRDLAAAVSNEIMHSVRMQGGLLPQI